MAEKMKRKISEFFILGVFRNSFYKYLQIKIFWRNRYVLLLVSLIFSLNIITWFLWLSRLIGSGFVTDSYLNFLLNIPYIPRFYSFLFLGSFISLLNLFLSFFVYRKNSFFSFMLIGGTIFLNLLILGVTIFYIFSFNL
jgi:hypothetical protein